MARNLFPPGCALCTPPTLSTNLLLLLCPEPSCRKALLGVTEWAWYNYSTGLLLSHVFYTKTGVWQKASFVMCIFINVFVDEVSISLQVRSLLKDISGSDSCLSPNFRTTLSLCGVRLLCHDKHLARLILIYRQSLAESLFQTMGMSSNTVSSLLTRFSGTVCSKEVDQICPKQLLQWL